MLMHSLSKFLYLFSELCYITLYLLCTFPVVLLSITRIWIWIKITMFLYYVTLAMRLIWYLCSTSGAIYRKLLIITVFAFFPRRADL